LFPHQTLKYSFDFQGTNWIFHESFHLMIIRVGLIGGGNITETHARAVRSLPDAEVVAIHGSHKDRVDRLCREYGGKPFTDFETFLVYRPMDMVVIGSPSGLHATQGIAAAERGLHVLTEKPMDISTQRADALIQAAERHHVKLAVIFQDRLKPEVCRLKECVSSGALGKPILADARVKWYRPPEYYANSRWRGTLALDGGGALINQAIHTVDLLLWLLGDVIRVQARTRTAFHKIEGEDIAVAILEFANGALGVLQATTAAYPGYARRLEITGSEGTVILDNDQIVATDLRSKKNEGRSDISPSPAESASSPVVSDIRVHRAVLEDFIYAVQQNRSPICDGRDGRRSLSVIEAIYRSAKNSNHPTDV
jgi:UDP-N-acetyl-2-amino-2-deoxyglucuronate dehydrogenase